MREARRGEAGTEGGWMEIDCGVDGNKVVGDAVGGRGMLGLGVYFVVDGVKAGNWSVMVLLLVRAALGVEGLLG
jgi:hypothetical protein